jgi:hypothetical protein
MTGRRRLAAIIVVLAVVFIVGMFAVSRFIAASRPQIRVHGVYDSLGFAGGSCPRGGGQVLITDAGAIVVATAVLSERPVRTVVDGIPAAEYSWSATVPVLRRYAVLAAAVPAYYATAAELTAGIRLSC